MTEQTRISATQLFWLLVTGRLSGCLLLPADSLHALTVPDLVAVTLLQAVLLLAVYLPIAWYRRRCPHRCSRAAAAVYLPLALVVLYLDCLQFRDFAAHTVTAEFSVTLLTAALIVIGLTAALYGIEAVGRTATVIAAVGVSLLLVFGVLLIPQMQISCFPPSVFSGWRTVLTHTLRELPRTAELAAIGALYPYVGKAAGRAYGHFVWVTALLTLSVCLVTTGVLGDFAGMTAYPFYTAVTAAQAGVLERTDLLIVALWLGTFFVRVALFGVIVSEQACRLFGKRARLPAVGGAAVLLLLLSALPVPGEWLTVGYVALLALSCFGLPLWERRTL